ncbi:hypothetical protein ACTXT7_009461 [Hymenolepis weldensis]
MPKEKIPSFSQQLMDFFQLIEMFNSLSAESKAQVSKIEGFKRLNASFKFLSFSPTSYSVEISASIKIPDSAAAKDASKDIPDLIQDIKLSKFCKSSWYLNGIV